jgi:hypothetical protein
MPSDADEQPMVRPPDEFSDTPRELFGETTTVDARELFVGEPTQIFSDPEPMPILFVESGRDRGREFVLVPGETTVGRGMDNEVILGDLSVSRRHLQIVRDGDVLTLRDSGSGNGTIVNGRRVDVLVLRSGDRIEIGETVLVLRGLPPSTIEAPPAESDPTMPPIRANGSATGRDGQHEIAAPNDSLSTTWTPPVHPRTNPVVIRRRTLVFAGIGIALAASLVSAIVFAFVFEPTSPQTAPTNLVPLPAAPPAISAPAPAIPAPATPAPATPAPAIQPSSVDPMVGIVPSAVDPTQVQPTAHPGAEDTPLLGQRVDSPEPIEEVEPMAEESEARDDSDRTSRHRTRDSRRTSRDEASSRDPLDLVLRAYENGDFGSAARTARDRGQAARALQIDQFAIHFRNARTAPVGSNVSIAALERAIAIDNQIASGGRYGALLRPRLVVSYLEAAQGAIASRPEDACRRVQLALRLDPSHVRGVGLAQQCESRAERLMADARALERSEPARARALYQTILPMVRSSSALYSEARRRIEAISRTHTVDEDQ